MDDNTNTGTPAEPQVVEVDSIDVAVDPNDAIMDDTGKVIQHIDREKNITYKLKGTTNPLIDNKAADQKAADEKAKAGAPDPNNKTGAGAKDEGKKEGDDNPADDDAGENEIEYLNSADYILKKIGYDKDAIKVGDVDIKVSDLSEEQQLDIIVHEFDTAAQGYEAKIKELEARQPELKFDDPMAQQIVDYLKEGGDIKKLAKEIISRDPAAQAKILTDAEVVKLSIKEQFPTYTDKDVEDEFAELTENQVARRSKAQRAAMEAKKPDFKDLTDAQKLEQIAQKQKYQAEFDGEVTSVKEAAGKIKEIAGIPITDDVRNFLLKRAIPENIDSDSAFVKGLDKNPEKLIKLQFFDEYGEKIIAQLHDYYKGEIKKARNEGKQNLSDEPLRTYQSKTNKKEAVIKTFNDPDFNFEKWLNADKEF